MTLKTEVKKAKYQMSVHTALWEELKRLRGGLDGEEDVEIQSIHVDTNSTAATGSARIRISIPFGNSPGAVFKFVHELIEVGEWSVCRIDSGHVELRWRKQFGEHKS